VGVGPGGLSAVEGGGAKAEGDRIRIPAKLVEDALGSGASMAAVVDELPATGHYVGPAVLTDVPPEAAMAHEEIFGPVLSVVRVETVDDAIALVNSNPYGNGTAIFTSSGEAARRFQRGVQVGMIGINVPIPVPMAYYSFGGWKDSLFGDKHVHGPEGVSFYTRAKVITSRWPHVEHPVGASYHFPTHQ
jgi:malonate-semialdehyde dehydrogenase (acetylating) / methylmalonate-semialdehyde dehydrogenase